MKKRIQSMVLAGLLFGAQAGMAYAASEENPAADAAVSQIAKEDNELGRELMAEMIASELEGDKRNVFISPYSIATALSMLSHCSSEGEQIEELRNFLGYDGLDEQQILDGQRLLMESLMPDYGMDDMSDEEKKELGMGTVEIGNALYVSKKLDLLPEFGTLPELLAGYEAEVDEKELDTEEAMNEINDWVKKKTNDLIDSILDEPLSSDAAMLLMNTVYFMGNWANSFSEEATDKQTFYGTKEENEISMMHQQDRFLYTETDEYQMICLQYTYGYAMYVYLPKDPEAYKNWADAEYLKELTDQEYEFEDREVLLSMPKFEMEYDVVLNDCLEKLGMEKIFDSEVYDRITNEEMKVDTILHKTAIKNDEKGTEAAAVTAVVCETTALIEPETPVEVTMDHPFYFTITHQESGVNLFEGCIMNLDGEE